MRNAPAYTDGVLELYEAIQEPVGDYPKEKLQKLDMDPIWYREISIYDRTRAALGENGKQVTLKVQIPPYRAIDSHWYVKIDGTFHRIWNCAHGYNKDGFPVTELTLIATENNLEEVSG